MAQHILDRAARGTGDASILRYARAAQALAPSATHQALRYAQMRRRAKGPFDPAHRLRAYLQIERGFRA